MMRLGSYHAKAGRYVESMSHLQNALTIFNKTVPTSYHMSDCKMSRIHFFAAFTPNIRAFVQVNISLRSFFSS